MKSVGERAWRCAHCRVLLGIEFAGEMHIQYKGQHVIARGPLTIICRRCGAQNERVTT